MISRKKQARLKRLAQAEVNNMCKRYMSECRELGFHIETNEEKAKRLAEKQVRENNRWRLSL